MALDLAEDDRERVRAAVDLHLDDRVAVNRTEDALQLKDGGLERDGGLTAGVDVAGQDALAAQLLDFGAEDRARFGSQRGLIWHR